jgi:hypothetical protein
MLTQTDLFSPPPIPADAEVTRLLTYLHAHPGFHTRHQLAAALDLTERKVRQLAEHSEGYIMSAPGSPGYCHLDHCPIEIAARINDALISQGKSMIARGLRGKRLIHARIR